MIMRAHTDAHTHEPLTTDEATYHDPLWMCYGGGGQVAGIQTSAAKDAKELEGMEGEGMSAEQAQRAW